jgi:hypothetical protein
MAASDSKKAPFWNPDLPIEQRVADSAGRPTLDEMYLSDLKASVRVPRRWSRRTSVWKAQRSKCYIN